jgi:3-hydroxyisobutyrate dehydrogenase
MRISRICLQAFQRHASSSSLAARASSISFLGLGRMGAQMANNLFSKHHALASDTSFVVCDAVPETAHSFSEEFRKHHPTARITVVDTPEQ